MAPYNEADTRLRVCLDQLSNSGENKRSTNLRVIVHERKQMRHVRRQNSADVGRRQRRRRTEDRFEIDLKIKVAHIQYYSGVPNGTEKKHVEKYVREM